MHEGVSKGFDRLVLGRWSRDDVDNGRTRGEGKQEIGKINNKKFNNYFFLFFSFSLFGGHFIRK